MSLVYCFDLVAIHQDAELWACGSLGCRGRWWTEAIIVRISSAEIKQMAMRPWSESTH